MVMELHLPELGYKYTNIFCLPAQLPWLCSFTWREALLAKELSMFGPTWRNTNVVLRFFCFQPKTAIFYLLFVFKVLEMIFN